MANPPMSDDGKKKLAAEFFKRGNEAMMKQNWDYACEMFRQCVDLVPEDLLFRQLLRGATMKKYNDNGTGASMAGMRLMGIKTSIKKTRMQSDWNAVINLAEDGLAINPWDPGLNADLGEALSAVGFYDAAIFCFERAIGPKAELQHLDWLRRLAQLYQNCGKYTDAIEIFTRIARIEKLDEVARQQVDHSTAETDRVARYFSGAEFQIREPADDPELALLRQAVQAAREAAHKNPDNDDAKRKYQELKQSLLLREIEVYIARLRQFPDDSTVKFHLAVSYMHDKRHQLAIPLFQKLRQDPRWKFQSLLNLGLCFVFEHQFALAMRQFQLAALESVTDGNEELINQLNYYIERLRKFMGDDDDMDWGAGMAVLA